MIKKLIVIISTTIVFILFSTTLIFIGWDKSNEVIIKQISADDTIPIAESEFVYLQKLDIDQFDIPIGSFLIPKGQRILMVNGKGSVTVIAVDEKGTKHIENWVFIASDNNLRLEQPNHKSSPLDIKLN